MQLNDEDITTMLKPLELEPTPEHIARVREVLGTGATFPIHRIGIGADGLGVRWFEDGDDVGARAPAGSWVSSEQTRVIAIEGEPLVGVVMGETLVLGLRTARKWRAMVL